MRHALLLLATLVVMFASADAFATAHGPFPCTTCALATPIPDGGPAGSTLGQLNSLRDTIAGSPYGFSVGDTIELCNNTTCVTYTWRGIINNQMVWAGGSPGNRIGPVAGGGGGEGPGPGSPGPGGGFTLITLCGYVNNILDICLTYVASDPDDPGTGGDTN
jgi:hypothetical protein